MVQLEALLKLVGGARDNALLRFAIASEQMKQGQYADAVSHLRQALQWQDDYTAAWKLLGRCLAGMQDNQAAVEALAVDLDIARAIGGKQLASCSFRFV